jgi:hydroxypyruvate isomerase
VADLELVANVSLLFAEVPLHERFRAAADAGFQGAELWWPFDGPVPPEAEVERLLAAVAASGIPLRGMNLWAGDMAGGERGVLSQPTRSIEFEASLRVAAHIAAETGCRVFNALYGQRLASESPEVQDATAVDNLALAVRMLGATGRTVLLEPLSVGLNGDYPIVTAADALAVIAQVRERSNRNDGIALLFDTFHLTNNGEDLLAVIRAAGSAIGHVQLADAPGRGEPGSGAIGFPPVLEALVAAGYPGAVAAEYVPSAATVDTLGWVAAMPHLHLHRSR